MNNDQELLELAAKAAGIKNPEVQDMRGWGEVRHGFSEAIFDDDREEYWNPLVDGADALRLAAKLKIDLEWQHDEDTVEAYVRSDEGSTYCPSYPASEYKRAIVDVAAHIGRSLT